MNLRILQEYPKMKNADSAPQLLKVLTKNIIPGGTGIIKKNLKDYLRIVS